MFLNTKKRYTFLAGVLTAFITAIISVTGCNNTTTNTPTTVANPNVKTYDSLYVAETIDSTSYCGIDLLLGKTVLRDNLTKDCQLLDTNSNTPPTGLYLRSGDLSYNNPL